MTSAVRANAQDFLREAAARLDFRTGEGWYLLDDQHLQVDPAKMGWIRQARNLHAKAIFFVGDNPTVLFFQLDSEDVQGPERTEEDIRKLHLQVWNTSRIPVFFVALPGEIRVYSAYQQPERDLNKWARERRWLGRVREITEIAESLKEFSRPFVESGALFSRHTRDFNREHRVDQLLLRNLRLLRKHLEGESAEKREYAHALIGRSIFIRYLEDREVLVPEYFRESDSSGERERYTDFLKSKEATYHLFYQLRRDFNGDLFPLSSEEEAAIKEADLHTLRDFLVGQSLGDQPDLFFWAYRFDIIPIELISNIYEEFYHEHGGAEDRGTHYTPTPLVEFILNQCLTLSRLDANARVLDPACGSGIFLVEAYKRIVYHEYRRRQLGDLGLPRDELERLLTQRIVGIDLNKSAVQVAAFSLYLAYLDFLRPRDIRQHKRLPNLIHESDREGTGGTLYYGNAFSPTVSEREEIKRRISRARYSGRSDDLRMSEEDVWPIEDSQFDVIVGNPPWGSGSSSGVDLAVRWCEAFRYPVGDRELSQCFMWRAQRLLKPNGEVGLLVSTGVLFKHQEKSREFRKEWLMRNRIRAVYNFAHVRDLFFKKQKKEAIAPFAAIFFSPFQGPGMHESGGVVMQDIVDNRILYVSVKRSALLEQLQAVIIDQTDMHQRRQTDFLANDWLWKTLMWGGDGDVELIGELKSLYPSLATLVSDYGIGYQEGGTPQRYSTDDLGVAREITTDDFSDERPIEQLLQPIEHRKIHRVRNTAVYEGPRLLIKRGVSRSGERYGEIHARLASAPFAFRHSIIGFRLDSLTEDDRQILLAIVRSSLAKYYHFLTCSTWGFWHFEIHEEEHLSLPILFPQVETSREDRVGSTDRELRERILTALDGLSSTSSQQPSLFDSHSGDLKTYQNALDEAIFDLYRLSQAQRDLVRDLCESTLEFFYEGTSANAMRVPDLTDLEEYRFAFVEIWRDILASKGKELEARIYLPTGGLLCGVSFELRDLGCAEENEPVTSDSEWKHWFARLGESLRHQYTSRIFIDRVLKEVTESSMLIIKRSHRRLWTRSQARQDAREFLGKIFLMELQQRDRGVA